MGCARIHISQIGSIVVVKIDTVRHKSGRFCVRTALAEIVVAPRKRITNSRHHNRMALPARNGLQFKVEKRVDKDGGVFRFN